MALSSENKSKIIFHLGYPAKSLISSSTHYDQILADRLDNLDTFSETLAVSLVTKIEALKTKIEASPESFKLKQVGDIVFNVDSGLAIQKKELRRLISELSSLLDIPSIAKNGSMINIGV